MLIALAAVLATISALSGIFAVGNGRHWHFTVVDYFRGKRNAILYLWVITSTVFSICHSGVLVEYGLRSNWALSRPDDAVWMTIHTCVGILLTCAHIFVASTLAKEVGPVDKYLWGANRRAVS